MRNAATRLTESSGDRLLYETDYRHRRLLRARDSEEKREPASDIDTAIVDGLKALDPDRPIREADIALMTKTKRDEQCGSLSRSARRTRDVCDRVTWSLRGGWGRRHDRGDRRLLARNRCRKRQAVRVIGPEYEYRGKHHRRQHGGDPPVFERQQVGYEVRDKGKHREHRDIEPVHLTKINRHEMSS
jgi:hypothetical protein